ncbi:TIGR02530 family flagellar biosynthesis protein [Desulforamulus hydrothermalis]|uniref:Flagellar operon protein n=1 Tax=Desulforamulus hydrothermalis Lam5 = DSM 18033 TaxID=1121428 RepID=K8EKV5_9FIRM|nr:TIGR02530 family flagellar biosynthesis protein [Desulforamulus hydrothermalis]CCO09171.1 Flagellar operon protein [Desulforamulus hydrothermalis Lam5 = DSM 18033]SHH11334.1 flagellar operon protein [Desulforamulus hydrothermalis Lam5 = DSM 18033]
MQPCSQANKTVQANRLKENNLSFQELLHQEFRRQQEVKLSAHAAQRLREREIVLTEQDFSKINQAVQRAAAKGARDSLVLYGDLALIASVANRTIITAVDSKNMAEHVFTNIDSAVIVK